MQLLNGPAVADQVRLCLIKLLPLVVSKQSQNHLMAALIVACFIAGKADSKGTNSSAVGPWQF